MRGKIASPFYVTAINTAGSSNTDKCGQCIEARARAALRRPRGALTWHAAGDVR